MDKIFDADMTFDAQLKKHFDIWNLDVKDIKEDIDVGTIVKEFSLVFYENKNTDKLQDIGVKKFCANFFNQTGVLALLNITANFIRNIVELTNSNIKYFGILPSITGVLDVSNSMFSIMHYAKKTNNLTKMQKTEIVINFFKFLSNSIVLFFTIATVMAQTFLKNDLSESFDKNSNKALDVSYIIDIIGVAQFIFYISKYMYYFSSKNDHFYCGIIPNDRIFYTKLINDGINSGITIMSYVFARNTYLSLANPSDEIYKKSSIQSAKGLAIVQVVGIVDMIYIMLRSKYEFSLTKFVKNKILK